ncbi:glycosyltransferase [Microterricola viridarii]|uniref:Uncharacterized protein n=1 Tax=Microterricola viridarii TaxID=412690 RepID=A0A109QX95_9MICO|nr:glycosyltransferase [Microterricola viridarii]AMB59585.1 hypothetical protein AWU67_12705 [Microterricola viridarii]
MQLGNGWHERLKLGIQAKPVVGFWRLVVLQSTETFIRTQSDALITWQARTVGFKAIASSLSRADDLVAQHGRYRSAVMLRLFRLTRKSRRLERLFSSAGAEMIHAHFSEDAGLITPTARRLNLPTVVSVYGFDVTRALPNTQLGRRQARRRTEAFEYASAILANSRFMAESAVVCGADPSKVEVVHLGIALSSAPAQADNAERDGILFVGRLVEKKGLEDLIRAASLFPPELAGTKIVVVGDGPLRSELELLAQQHGVNVDFKGSQHASAIQAEMDAAALLCVPSKTAADGDSEGLPTIILEGAYAGLPVVSTEHSGIPEAVVSGTTGILVPENNPERLSEALSELLSDRAKAARYGAAGRAHIAEHFDSAECARKLEAVYSRVVAQHATR